MLLAEKLSSGPCQNVPSPARTPCPTRTRDGSRRSPSCHCSCRAVVVVVVVFVVVVVVVVVVDATQPGVWRSVGAVRCETARREGASPTTPCRPWTRPRPGGSYILSSSNGLDWAGSTTPVERVVASVVWTTPPTPPTKGMRGVRNLSGYSAAVRAGRVQAPFRVQPPLDVVPHPTPQVARP